MGVAALISWLVTAFFGLYLLAVWLIEYDVTGEGAPRQPTAPAGHLGACPVRPDRHGIGG